MTSRLLFYSPVIILLFISWLRLSIVFFYICMLVQVYVLPYLAKIQNKCHSLLKNTCQRSYSFMVVDPFMVNNFTSFFYLHDDDLIFRVNDGSLFNLFHITKIY